MICQTCKSPRNHTQKARISSEYLLNSNNDYFISSLTWGIQDDRLAFLVCQVNKKKRQKFDGRASQSEIAKKNYNTQKLQNMQASIQSIKLEAENCLPLFHVTNCITLSLHGSSAHNCDTNWLNQFSEVRQIKDSNKEICYFAGTRDSTKSRFARMPPLPVYSDKFLHSFVYNSRQFCNIYL